MKKSKNAFFQFLEKKTSNIISKFNDNFSKDFFDLLHISVGKKIFLETVLIFWHFQQKRIVISNIFKFWVKLYIGISKKSLEDNQQ